jgi:hypothetical protein
MSRGSLPLLAASVVVAALLTPTSSTTSLVAAPSAGPAGATAGVQGVELAPVDFDGDFKTDWAIVRNTGGGPNGQLTWFTLTQTGVVTVTPWGLAGDLLVPGDYDGDGKADIAVWRPGSTGRFFVRRSTDGSLLVQPFGTLGDDPKVIGDYDGDGRTDFAVYRQGATPGAQSTWFWLRSSDSQFRQRVWGLQGDVPVPGDFDGDHIADFGVRRDVGGSQAVFYLDASTASFRTVGFGFPSDVVVPGDYDGDGKTDLAVTRKVGGQLQWYVLRSLDGGVQGLSWGIDSDLSVQGDYNTDVAVWRASADPTANRFWVLASGGAPMIQQWGLQDDYPVANFNSHGVSAPAITSAIAAAFPVGVASTFTVTTTGLPRPAISMTGALPSGVTFVDNGNGTGTLSGTPLAGTAGAYPLTFLATNAGGSSQVQHFTLSVVAAPAITSAASTMFTIGAPASFTVTTTGFPPPTIARGGAALPPGVTFVDNLNGTGTLSGTAATGGVFALTFTATNSVGSSPVQNFTLTVTGGPVITSAAAATFTEGVAGSFTVTTNGFPLPSIAIGGVALPAGLTFVDNGNGTGTLSGTPAAATGGAYAITFTATNTLGSSPAQAFTLTVRRPPVITSAAATTFTVGAAGAFTVVANGFPAPTIAIGGAALPAGVTFTDNLNGTGTLSGTPAAGTGGTYALTFTATNAAGSTAPQAFTLTVNQAPAITSANTTAFTENTPGSFTVTTSGFPGGAGMTITPSGGGGGPEGVTFVDNGDGTATISGTPETGSAGEYVVTITASNGVAPDAVQNFVLAVNGPPAFTSADSATFTFGTPGSFTMTTTGYPSGSLMVITYTGALPAGVTFVNNSNGSATIAGTPEADGVYPLVLKASNGIAPDATQNFTLTVVDGVAFTSATGTKFSGQRP